MRMERLPRKEFSRKAKERGFGLTMMKMALKKNGRSIRAESP